MKRFIDDNLLNTYSFWKPDPVSYLNINVASLARMTVERHVFTTPASKIFNISGWQSIRSDYTPGSAKEKFLQGACNRVGIALPTITNSDYRWTLRIAADAEQQQQGHIPSNNFIQNAINNLLEGGSTSSELRLVAYQISKMAKKCILQPKISVGSLPVAAVAYFHAPLISAAALGTSAFFTYRALKNRSNIGTALTRVENYVLPEICDSWIAAAGDVAKAKIGLKDIMYGKEKVAEEFQGNKRGLTALKLVQEAIFGASPIPPRFGADDVGQKTSGWRNHLIDDGINTKYGSIGPGFIIQITSPDPDLAGTHLQLVAKPRAFFTHNNNRNDGSGGPPPEPKAKNHHGNYTLAPTC